MMGYWSTSKEGHSFAVDSPLVWGDGPADEIGEGVSRIVDAMRSANGEAPTRDQVFAIGVKAVDDLDNPAAVQTYLHEAVVEAGAVFTDGMGRAPVRDELIAGVNFALGGLFDEDGTLSA